MKTHILILAAMTFLTSSSQTFQNPTVLSPGEVSIPVDGIRATGYYTYTAPTDQLLTLYIPSPDATLYVSEQPKENPTYSELPVMGRRMTADNKMRYRLLAPKGKQLFMKTSFICWDLPESGNFMIDVSTEDISYKDGYTPSDPIIGAEESTIYLPLTVDSDAIMKPVYVSFDTDQYGYLSLDFEPSVTQIDYSYGNSDDYIYLKHNYVMEENQTVGAKAMLPVKPGEHIMFRIKGFAPSILTLKQIDPEPGTICEFPLDVEPGTVTLPAGASDFYYRIKPEEESYIEITSLYSLPGGFVRVMMDCNGFGAFTIYDELNLRAHVWDNMEYIIHVSRPEAPDRPEEFELRLTPELPSDSFYGAEEIEPGNRYETLPFAGTYYYRITAPDLIGSTLKLTTLENPADSDTRASLFDADNDFDVIATGLNLEYTVKPNASYVLKYSVFDNRLALPFSFSFEGGESGITEMEEGDAAYNGTLRVCAPDGKPVGEFSSEPEMLRTLTPGLYIVIRKGESEKITVK